jgi:hypothetical protein
MRLWRDLVTLVAVGTLSDLSPSLAGSGARAEPPSLRTARVIEVADGAMGYKCPVWSPDRKNLVFIGADWRSVRQKC